MKYPIFKRGAIYLLLLILSGCLAIGLTHRIRHAREYIDKDPSRAIAEYRQLIAQYPSDPEIPRIKYELGLILIEQNELPMAIAEFQGILQQYPYSQWATASEVELITLESDLSSESLETLEDLLKKDIPPDIKDRIHYSIAEIHYKAGRWTEALNAYRQAIAMRKEKTYQYWLHIGICLLRIGDYVQAEQELKKAESYHPTQDPAIVLALAELFQRTDRFDEAINVIFSALMIAPDTTILNTAKDLLSTHFNDSQLDQLSPKYTAGLPGYLLRMESIQRSASLGNYDHALLMLSQLKTAFPDYHNEINETINELENRADIQSDHIGLLAPLSGEISSIGHSVYQGAQFAIDDYNSLYPEHRFEMIIRDTAGQTDSIHEDFKYLAETEKVLGIVGPIRSDTTEMIAPMTIEYQIPVITPGCPKSDICNKSPFLFRIFPSAYREAYMLAEFTIDKLKLPNVACIYPNTAYGQAAYEGFCAGADNFKGQLHYSVSYSDTTQNFGTLLQKLITMPIDVIFIPDRAEKAAQIAGQIRYLEILEPIIIGIGAWEDDKLTQISGPHLQASYFLTEFPVHTGSRKLLGDRYLKRYGEAPDAMALRTYEATAILLQASASGVKYREQLDAYLKASTGIPVLDGLACFNTNHDLETPVLIYRLENGRITPWFRWEHGYFYSLFP